MHAHTHTHTHTYALLQSSYDLCLRTLRTASSCGSNEPESFHWYIRHRIYVVFERCLKATLKSFVVVTAESP